MTKFDRLNNGPLLEFNTLSERWSIYQIYNLMCLLYGLKCRLSDIRCIRLFIRKCFLYILGLSYN